MGKRPRRKKRAEKEWMESKKGWGIRVISMHYVHLSNYQRMCLTTKEQNRGKFV